jgi:transketolase
MKNSEQLVPVFRIFPLHVTARIAVVQASTFGWERYIGKRGRMIGMKTFGASAPLKELHRKFGFTPDSIVTAAKEQVTQGR